MVGYLKYDKIDRVLIFFFIKETVRENFKFFFFLRVFDIFLISADSIIINMIKENYAV